jgi:DNA-binding winged helix-turn-helix (wHTH) protein
LRLQFNDLTFDSASRQIWLGAEEVRLSPKAFELLALLIDRRPAAVPKADIRDHLWPGTFVSDSSLPSLVSEIREAIADREREPGLLRTVHGFGYAFQAPMAPVEDAAANLSPIGWLIGPSARIGLFAGENILGREGAGVILVKSSTVSRRHASIAVNAQGAVLADLGSKNGTYVNDRRVNESTPVVDGDQVRIGGLLFTFRLSDVSKSTETQSSTVSRRSHS